MKTEKLKIWKDLFIEKNPFESIFFPWVGAQFDVLIFKEIYCLIIPFDYFLM